MTGVRSELDSQDSCTTAMSMTRACRQDAGLSDLDLMSYAFNCRMRRDERVTNFCPGVVGVMFVHIELLVDIAVGHAEVQFSALCFSSFRFMPQHLTFMTELAALSAA